MTHRGYRNSAGEDDLSLYGRRETVPDTRSGQKGICVCGTETTRYKTFGPPGHPLNGWQCRACSEAEMAAIFKRAVNK
jgi:hypothetical protein